jgi:hypothetical protein
LRGKENSISFQVCLMWPPLMRTIIRCCYTVHSIVRVGRAFVR